MKRMGALEVFLCGPLRILCALCVKRLFQRRDGRGTRNLRHWNIRGIGTLMSFGIRNFQATAPAMKNPLSIIYIAAFVLISFVSAFAQETAGVLPVKAGINDAGAVKVAEASLTDIYRVGVGDVLDIRLLNSSNNSSTLFTVIGNGVIELPIAGGAIKVAGLTLDEIQSRIAAELTRRSIEDNAKVSVGVRQYASHSVTVTGLVVHPGTRFLRREEAPLYVVLAESQLRNDGGRVVILRNGAETRTLDLRDSAALNTHVQSGDVITVESRPEEFYFIGGRINYPGQKQFTRGITLLQAILAAGGTPRHSNLVEISRAGSDGRLATMRYNLKEIKSGNLEDPKLQPGDRIEVGR